MIGLKGSDPFTKSNLVNVWNEKRDLTPSLLLCSHDLELQIDMKIENREHVIPAEAGIQQIIDLPLHQKSLDSRFRGNDA